jgi:6-phosphogluconolactonase
MVPNFDHHRIFVGTYTKGTSRGIYSAALDGTNGALGEPVLAAEAPNPSFLALSPDRRLLYAVCAGPGWASSFRIAPGEAGLTPVHQGIAGTGPTPCHIAVDATGRVAIAANYHLGLAAAIPLGSDGSLGTPHVVAHRGKGPHPTRQETSHVHSANFSPDGRFAVVCDLGLDRIYTYAIDRQAVALKPGNPPFVATAPGAGPRHLAFGKDRRHAYAVNELDSTLVAYDFEPSNGALHARQSVTLLAPGYKGESSAAEVRVHPNGRFVYASVRGPDTLAVFAADASSGSLSAIEIVPCGGNGPRSFAVSPDGKWLVCAHQNSDTLCVFRVNADSGRLHRIPGTVPAPMPVCVLFAA